MPEPTQNDLREQGNKTDPHERNLPDADTAGILVDNSMAVFPPELRYASTHEWVRLDGDLATIGITDFAQSELGDIVFIELPEAGRVLQVGETFGTVESVKSVSEVYAPIAGTVTEVNAAVVTDSELVNRDPFGKGYLMVIRVNDPAEVNTLLDAEAYQATTH
jgi:glycine cleavage system H protein